MDTFADYQLITNAFEQLHLADALPFKILRSNKDIFSFFYIVAVRRVMGSLFSNVYISNIKRTLGFIKDSWVSLFQDLRDDLQREKDKVQPDQQVGGF